MPHPKHIPTLLVILVVAVLGVLALTDSPLMAADDDRVDWPGTYETWTGSKWEDATPDQRQLFQDYVVDAFSNPRPDVPGPSDLNWIERDVVYTSVQNGEGKPLPAPPSNGDQSTLGDSMFARWQIQYDMAVSLRKIADGGITVQADPALLAAQQKTNQLLEAVLEKPGGGLTDEQFAAWSAAIGLMRADLAAIKQNTAQPASGGGLTDEQLKTLSDAIENLGKSLDGIAKTLAPSSPTE